MALGKMLTLPVKLMNETFGVSGMHAFLFLCTSRVLCWLITLLSHSASRLCFIYQFQTFEFLPVARSILLAKMQKKS
jgi:hypothetical protein